MNWQPIETAPKDGTRVLLFWLAGLYGSRHIEFGRWDDDKYARKGPRPYWTGERPNNASAYRASQPTHWMPMPEPPK
jgi:hypothetical protein